MIPLPDAQAAYNRIVSLTAQPGDTDLLIAAAQQGGMPADIVALGNAVNACETAWKAYEADPTDVKALAWSNADEVIAKLLGR